MHERWIHTPSRKERFFRSKVPDAIYLELNGKGFFGDYLNTFFTTELVADWVQNPSPHNPPDARTRMKTQLHATQTYTDYVKNRLGSYNATAQASGTPPINIETTFKLLVTQQKGAATLDAIARSLRRLATTDLTPEQLVTPFVEYAANAYHILKGPKAAKKIRSDFGVPKKV